MKQDKGKQATQVKLRKHVTSVDGNTLALVDTARAHLLDVVVWVTKLQIAQRLHGIVGVTLRDPEWESS